MNYILFDDINRNNLLPFTHTRAVVDIRCGIMTMRERWEHVLEIQNTLTLTQQYIQPTYPANWGINDCYINGGIFATTELANAIQTLAKNHRLVKDGLLIAMHIERPVATYEELANLRDGYEAIEYGGVVNSIKNVWDIFAQNDRAVRNDFALITAGRTSAPIPEGITVTGANQLFIEPGANIYAGCVINAANGPVYIGKMAQVLEGCLMRGPIAIGEGAVVKMGAKIYGATTIGPGCKVGGEMNNVVFFANSNKSHDGYLGNAVIGEWCNLGADTNCSNLKNNYDEVKIWDEANRKSIKTGLTFCGLLMGDHSKCGINTMFNTGTVVGVSCNIFGGGFPEKFVPSFSWGGSDVMTTYDFNRAMETADRMMSRRGAKLSEAELNMFRHIYENR